MIVCVHLVTFSEWGRFGDASSFFSFASLLLVFHSLSFFLKKITFDSNTLVAAVLSL